MRAPFDEQFCGAPILRNKGTSMLVYFAVRSRNGQELETTWMPVWRGHTVDKRAAVKNELDAYVLARPWHVVMCKEQVAK